MNVATHSCDFSHERFTELRASKKPVEKYGKVSLKITKATFEGRIYRSVNSAYNKSKEYKELTERSFLESIKYKQLKNSANQ